MYAVSSLQSERPHTSFKQVPLHENKLWLIFFFLRLLNRSCCAINCISSGLYGTAFLNIVSFFGCFQCNISVIPVPFVFRDSLCAGTYTVEVLAAFITFFYCHRIVCSLFSKNRGYLCPQKYMKGCQDTQSRLTTISVSTPQQATGTVRETGKAVIIKSASKMCIKSMNKHYFMPNVS